MSHNSDKPDFPAISPDNPPKFSGFSDCRAGLAHGPAVARDSILPAVPGQREFLEKMLTGSQAKTAYALRLNAEAMIKAGGLNSTGFLTLTLGDFDENGKFQCVFDSKEASRRLNNLNRRVLGDLFEKAIVVTERMKSGAIHFHLLGVIRGRPDIRTGLNFDRVKGRDYRTVPEPLREIWAYLRKILPDYGFGRAELLPVKKTGEAVACYVSKYIEKNVCNRLPQDKHKKLVRYLNFDKKQIKPNDFGWASARACAWRGKTRECAALLGIQTPEQAALALGPRWAWRISSIWTKIDDVVRPFIQWDSFGQREIARRELYQTAHHDYLRVLNLPFAHDVRIGGELWMKDEWAEFMSFAKN